MYEGIMYLNCRNVSLTHSNVEHFVRGIWLYASSDCFVSTNRLSDNYIGFGITRCNNSKVWQNEVYNSIYAGVTMNDLNHGIQVRNNTIINNDFVDDTYGIMVAYFFYTKNYDTILDGNTILGYTRGLCVLGTKGLTVTNNVIGDSTGPAIHLWYSKDAVFIRN